MNIEREARENIRREVTSRGGAVDFYRHNGDVTRAVIKWLGKSREVRFKRVSGQPHVMRSIMSDTRREMRNLGIIDRDKGRAPIRESQVGAIGAKLLEAVKKAAPEEFAAPPEPEIEMDVGSADDDENREFDGRYDLPEDAILCPDEIASRRQPVPPQETRPMKEQAATSTPHPVPHPNGAGNGQKEAQKEPKAVETVVGGKLKNLEVMDATKLMLRHGDTADGGVYSYHEGWTDERVHREIGTKASVLAVVTLRKSGGMRLASEIKALTKSDTARIEALEREVVDLKARLLAAGA